MRISVARLPRLLGVVVMAFAPYEPRPLVGAVQLFRGIAIEIAYRWPTGQILAADDDRAVILWSPASFGGDRRDLWSELLGVVVATAVGSAIVIAGILLLVLPIAVLLVVVGIDGEVVAVAALCLVAASLLVTCWRAYVAFRHEQSLTARLPQSESRRWRVDFLAALPSGRGHGGRLLDEFLAEADRRRAEVVLHCDVRNVTFYRRHGFRTVDGACPGGQHLMLRDVGGPRGASARALRSRSSGRP